MKLRRITKIIITVCVILSLFPVSAFAAGSDILTLDGKKLNLADQKAVQKYTQEMTKLYPSSVHQTLPQQNSGKIATQGISTLYTLSNQKYGKALNQSQGEYVYVRVKETGMSGVNRLLLSGESWGCAYTNQTPAETTNALTMTTFGVLPSVGFKTAYVSGATTASDTMVDSRSNSKNAAITFTGASTSYWNMIYTSFDASIACKYNNVGTQYNGTYYTYTNVTFWFS